MTVKHAPRPYTPEETELIARCQKGTEARALGPKLGRSPAAVGARWIRQRNGYVDLAPPPARPRPRPYPRFARPSFFLREDLAFMLKNKGPDA